MQYLRVFQFLKNQISQISIYPCLQNKLQNGRNCLFCLVANCQGFIYCARCSFWFLNQPKLMRIFSGLFIVPLFAIHGNNSFGIPSFQFSYKFAGQTILVCKFGCFLLRFLFDCILLSTAFFSCFPMNLQPPIDQNSISIYSGNAQVIKARLEQFLTARPMLRKWTLPNYVRLDGFPEYEAQMKLISTMHKFMMW